MDVDTDVVDMVLATLDLLDLGQHLGESIIRDAVVAQLKDPKLKTFLARAKVTALVEPPPLPAFEPNTQELNGPPVTSTPQRSNSDLAARRSLRSRRPKKNDPEQENNPAPTDSMRVTSPPKGNTEVSVPFVPQQPMSPREALGHPAKHCNRVRPPVPRLQLGNLQAGSQQHKNTTSPSPQMMRPHPHQPTLPSPRMVAGNPVSLTGGSRAERHKFLSPQHKALLASISPRTNMSEPEADQDASLPPITAAAQLRLATQENLFERSTQEGD